MTVGYQVFEQAAETRDRLGGPAFVLWTFLQSVQPQLVNGQTQLFVHVFVICDAGRGLNRLFADPVDQREPRAFAVATELEVFEAVGVPHKHALFQHLEVSWRTRQSAS